ncbi:MAG: RNA-binding protein [Candidatus Omnitrophica bacterium]|nr:RNA-binding protein [Candidatus Omnitrophota bacterium]
MSDAANKVYVGNLSYEVTEEQLNNFFEEKGITVTAVTVVKDRYTDRSKGFGFIELSSSEDVQKAIDAANGQELGGRTLNVSQARAKESRPPRSGGGYSRGGGGGRGRSDSRGGGGGNRGGGGGGRGRGDSRGGYSPYGR